MTDFCDKDMWPPSSLDLNPMDFAIWSILETDVCATPHSSTANLKRTLQTAWSNLDESAVRRSCPRLEFWLFSGPFRVQKSIFSFRKIFSQYSVPY